MFLLEILPDMLDPIPPLLARALGPDRAWTAWEREAEAALERGLT